MVSTRPALLLAFLLTVGLFAPAVDALAVPDLLPARKDDPQDTTPPRGGNAPIPEGSKVFSPYGLVPTPAPSPSISTAVQGDGFRLEGPYGDLVHGLASAPLSPARAAGLVADYYETLGFPTPGSSISFDENASISFSHELGDINGDGATDLLLDQYCTSYDACMPRLGPLLTNPRSLIDYPCSWPHTLIAVSAGDGSTLWNLTSRDLNHLLGAYVGCTNEFVVGTVPNEGHHDLLVYTYAMTYPHTAIGQNFETEVLIEHRIGLLDGTSGRLKWSKAFSGHILGEDYWTLNLLPQPTMTASNFLVNPLLQKVNPRGVPYMPPGQQVGLALQGVGFNLTGASTLLAAPYAGASYTLLNNYQPDEWAMGVDPLTGAQLWRRATFQPNEKFQGIGPPERPSGPRAPIGNISVQPTLLQQPPLPHTVCYYDPTIACRFTETQFDGLAGPDRAYRGYWGHNPCCFDLSGDGLPDLVYTTLEFYAFPLMNREGPYGTASRLIALDGRSGAPLYWHLLEKGTDDPLLSVGLQHFGDVDGDGRPEFFVHERHVTWDYHHDVELRSGKDGHVIWNLTVPRALQILPLGDANKDGAQDFVYADYTLDIAKVFAFRSVAQGTAYSSANVTFTDVKVRSGLDASVLWQYQTFEAPSDLLAVFQSYRVNGLPDLDRDGVADMLSDDPLFLPDLTKLHRFTARSGADGTILFKFVTAGYFAFPALVGDVTGDGRDDIYVINGDLVDLWGTLYSANGTAVWSRRVMMTRASSYTSVGPMIRTHILRFDNATSGPNDFLLNFQLRITQNVRSIGLGPNVFTFTTVLPQLVRYTAWNGTADWALPALWDQNMTLVVNGASPASELYGRAHDFDHERDRVPPAPLATPIQVLAGTTTFGAAFALSFFLGLRRWKP